MENYNNVFGYCDQLNPMQKGKILKILNKVIKFEGKLIKRKDFILNCVESGLNFSTKHNVFYKNKVVDIQYRIDLEDNYYYVMTKTEYDYAKYLEKHKIIVG